ncbi:MAG TPA: hypothetical protein VK195_06850 [Burkholderiaceae bacterium]|nr:hypothetical protein [Burkholderiaceae bacterium]
MAEIPSPLSAPRAWWRERMMWLVVGGPAAVVLASFVTLGMALKHPDPVIETQQRLAADSAADGPKAAALAPAIAARNHAATGGPASGK